MSFGGPTKLDFVVSIQNEEKLKELNEELQKEAEYVKKLSEYLRAGAISEQQFLAAVTPIEPRLKAINAEMARLQATSGGAGRGLSQLAYAVDDLQYGFNAIVNNLPQIVMGLGAGAGVAGAVGIAAVAVNQLIKHWDELKDRLQSAWSGSTVEQLEAIREKAEAAAEAFGKIPGHSKAEGATAAGATEAITDVGKAATVNALAAAIAGVPGLAANAPRGARGGVGIGAPGVIPVAGATDAEIAAGMRAANLKKAQELMGQATDPNSGEAGVRARNTIIGLMPGTDLAADLKALQPEEKERIAQLNLEAQGGRNSRKWAGERDKDIAKAEEDMERWAERKMAKDRQRADRLQHLGEQRADLLERKSRIMRPEDRQIEVFNSTADFIQKLQTAGPQKFDQQKLDQLKDVNKNLGRVEEAIKKLNARAG